jgi:hypothetical protein
MNMQKVSSFKINHLKKLSKEYRDDLIINSLSGSIKIPLKDKVTTINNNKWNINIIDESILELSYIFKEVNENDSFLKHIDFRIKIYSNGVKDCQAIAIIGKREKISKIYENIATFVILEAEYREEENSLISEEYENMFGFKNY